MYRFNHHVWEMQDLTVYEKIALLYLLDRANEHGICWPSLSTISRATGMSRKQVHRVLRSLKARGLVDWERIGEGGQYNNSYRLNLESIAGGGNSRKNRNKAGIEDALLENQNSRGGVYQTPGSVYQTPDGVYQTPDCCPPDTRVVSDRHTNQSINQPINSPNSSKSLESQSLVNDVKKVDVDALRGEDHGRGGKGALAVAEEENSPKAQLNPKAQHTPEDPLASLGPAAPLVRRIMGQAPGKATLILERAKAMAEMYGSEVLELLWKHALATADYSPLGAWLRYADPTVPLPPEVRQALKGSAFGLGEATPSASKPTPNRSSIAFPGYKVVHSSDDANPLEALATGRMRLDEEGLAARMPWLVEWAKDNEQNPWLVSKIIQLHRQLSSYGPRDFANGLTPEIIITPEELLEAFEGDEPFLPPQDWWRGVEAEAKRLWRERVEMKREVT